MTETRTYTVTGMTCAHCVASVTEEVQEIDGVEAVDVRPRDRPPHRDRSAVDDAAVRAAVEEAGYQLA